MTLEQQNALIAQLSAQKSRIEALTKEIGAWKAGGCPCRLEPSWDGESHHNTCPEIRDELERGYCERIKALTAALSRYVPCRVCKIHGYGQCAGCDATMALLSPAPRPEDEKPCTVRDCCLIDGHDGVCNIPGSVAMVRLSDEKPKEDK